MPLKLDIPADVIRQIEKSLEVAPPMIREKLLKNTFKEASELFTRQVQNNIVARKAEGRDRWGKESIIDMENAIRTRVAKTPPTQVGVIVDVHGKLPETAQYATSTEYGHDKVVFGVRTGGRVQGYPFWRPAKTSTEGPITRLVTRALNRYIREIVFGGRR